MTLMSIRHLPVSSNRPKGMKYMPKRIICVLFVFLLTLGFVTARSEQITDQQKLVDEITNARTRSLYNIDLNAPFSKAENGLNENVNVETGEMSVNLDLFSLPMHAGEKLDAAILYSPSVSCAYDEGIDDDGYNAKVEKEKLPRTISCFGVGWQLKLPYVENPGKRNISSTYVRLENGAVYLADSSEDNGLADYELSDVTYIAESASADGVMYNCTLAYNSGVTYWFNSEGLPELKTDRFGNKVSYNWEKGSKYNTIKSISDNSGNCINFDFNGNSVTVSCAQRSYKMLRTQIDKTEDVWRIDSVTDPLGRVTKFGYHDEKIEFAYMPEEASSAQNDYAVLDSITYPTGLKCVYEYEKGKKWLYEKKKGYIESLRLKKRYDISDGRQENVTEYEYTGNPSGYPLYSPDKIPEYYSYTTTEKDFFGNYVWYLFDSKHNPIKKVRHYGEDMAEDTDTMFDEKLRLPVKTIVRDDSPDGNFGKKVTEQTYDKYGNVLSLDVYDTEPGKYKREYNYSSFGICVGEKYMKDKNTKVEIVRTLTALGKSIGSETVFENGVEIKHDDYEYTPLCDIKRSRVQTGKDTFAVTEYEYSGSYPCPNAVTNKDVENADGVCENITTHYEYDKFGNVVKIDYGNGIKKSYSYDLLGRRIEETLEDGLKRTAVYNDTENSITTTDARGTSLVYKYSQAGLLQSVTDYLTGNVFTMRTYDEMSRLVTEKLSTGALVKSEYDGRDRLVSYETYDDSGKLYESTKLSYNGAPKQCLGGTEITVLKFDGKKERKTVYLYDILGSLISTSVYADGEVYVTENKTDYLGNIVSEIDANGNETKYERDIFGNPTRVINPLGAADTYDYDFMGNAVKHINAENEVEENIYDSLGRLISVRTHYGDTFSESVNYYDRFGNAVKTVDANGNTVLNSYNSRGFLTSTVSYAKSNRGIISEYEYDGEGAVISASYGDAANRKMRKVTKNYYDHLGNLKKVIDNSGKVSYYTYNEDGKLLSFKDPNGVLTDYTYDVLGRVTRMSNSKNGDINYSYNPLGELESVSGADGTVEYSYNDRGLVTNAVRGLSDETYSYDRVGNVLSHILKDASADMKTEYTYDKANRITAVSTPLGVQSIFYDFAGRVVKSANNATGAEKLIEYDGRGLVSHIKTVADGKTIFEENNTYDKLGNKTISVENGITTKYRYDGMNRLTSVIKGENETVYDFDCYNNIEKKYELFLDNKSTTRYHYDSANRLVMSENGTNAVHYEYDDSGNLTKKTDNNGSVRYSYDGFNRLKSVASGENIMEYAYTPEGFRSKKTVNGSTTRYLYDGANICAEVIPDGTAYTYYRADGIIGSVHGDEKLYYSQTSRGDVSVVYDTAGNVVKSNTYSPYGERKTVQKVNDTNDPLRLMWVAETENVHIPFGYCGEYTDDETGFVYLRNRYYDPEVGRFITEDPIRDGVNWYVYCENNPVSNLDPNGLYTLDYKPDGRVIAIIEDGDTLGDIAYTQVGDRFAYTKIKAWDGSDLTDYDTVVEGEGYDITGIYNKYYRNPNPYIGTPGLTQFINAAVGEMPYVEGYNNDTKYGIWYGSNHQPWCAMFVSWSAEQAGLMGDIVPSYKSCYAGRDWYIARNRFHLTSSGYIPKAGDVIFVSSDKYPRGGAHTGIVIAYSNGYIYTVEGNASDSIRIIKHPLSYVYGFGSNGGIWCGEIPEQYNNKAGSTY